MTGRKPRRSCSSSGSIFKDFGEQIPSSETRSAAWQANAPAADAPEISEIARDRQYPQRLDRSHSHPNELITVALVLRRRQSHA